MIHDPFSGERSRIPGKCHSYWEEAYPITPKHMYNYTISWTLTPPVIVAIGNDNIHLNVHPFCTHFHIFCGIIDFSQAIVLIPTKPFPRKLGKRRCHRDHHRNAEKALVDPLLPCYVAAPNTAAKPCLAIPPRLPENNHNSQVERWVERWGKGFAKQIKKYIEIL